MDITAQASMTLPGFDGFRVRLTCSSHRYRESSENTGVYQLAALSEYVHYDKPEYVARHLALSVLVKN